MQLPRGTFREIRKGVAIESLLHALDGEKFSGVTEQLTIFVMSAKAGISHSLVLE